MDPMISLDKLVNHSIIHIAFTIYYVIGAPDIKAIKREKIPVPDLWYSLKHEGKPRREKNKHNG